MSGDWDYTQITLGRWITLLNAALAEGNRLVKPGLFYPHSSRSRYADVAFEVDWDGVYLGDMLEAAKDAIGTTYRGWKGGDFTMDENSMVHICDEEGDVGQELTPFIARLILS